MNSKKLLLFVIALALIVGTGALLGRLSALRGQKLGNPGVRLAAQPLYDEVGKMIATNSVDLPANVLDLTSRLLPITEGEIKGLPADTIFKRRSMWS
jgi:hypothetical protein